MSLCQEQREKKRKLDDKSGDDSTHVIGLGTNSNQEAVVNEKRLSSGHSVFKDFNLIRVLREDVRHKMITLHGSLPLEDDGENKKKDAVLLLERKSFEVSTLENSLRLTKTVETLHNDIYSTHDVYGSESSAAADIKATLIHPATEKHITKYADHEPFIIQETQELYQTVTLPCIKESKFSIQWVYNILEKKTESDRILVEDPDPDVGFVMVPDMKWDCKNIDALYMVAIVHKHGIKSLRDLRKEHLPLLENILSKGQSAIKENFAVTRDKLRVYFHYQPSYYHLHVHFTHVKFDAPGSDVLRAHLIEDVMENLSMDSDFYSKKTLSYVVRENDLLYRMFKEKGYFS
ncbi:unnamed protein product [Lymnaea stagnalis]|uniref:m7GpppX diphosphatase n=1 Tax=Lymnaea stagnalis TaxID=6523 RepID=A0AAV2H7X5_LYMST